MVGTTWRWRSINGKSHKAWKCVRLLQSRLWECQKVTCKWEASLLWEADLFLGLKIEAFTHLSCLHFQVRSLGVFLKGVLIPDPGTSESTPFLRSLEQTGLLWGWALWQQVCTAVAEPTPLWSCADSLKGTVLTLRIWWWMGPQLVPRNSCPTHWGGVLPACVPHSLQPRNLQDGELLSLRSCPSVGGAQSLGRVPWGCMGPEVSEARWEQWDTSGWGTGHCYCMQWPVHQPFVIYSKTEHLNNACTPLNFLGGKKGQSCLHRGTEQTSRSARAVPTLIITASGGMQAQCHGFYLRQTLHWARGGDENTQSRP